MSLSNQKIEIIAAPLGIGYGRCHDALKERAMYVGVWICKDGRVIPINQMETSHIKNCIAMIERKRNWRRDFLDRLKLELLIRELQNQ